MAQHISETLVQKWAPILDHPSLDPITDPYRRVVTATVLENQEKASMEDNGLIFETTSGIIPNTSQDLNGPSNGNIARYDPVLISLIRRSLPQLIAYDVCGVQAMTGPVGLIFAMKSGYANTSNSFTSEALFNEANSKYSGTGGTQAALNNPASSANTLAGLAAIDAGLGLTTFAGETNDAWPQMGFEIVKSIVGVRSRQLKADYSVELSQDLKAVHNLDAESELSNILSHEILNEINREITRLIYSIAKPGGTNSTGSVNLSISGGDINGRYFAEQWRGLQFLIEKDATYIAKETRRGKGNFIITNSEVASALAMIGVLDYGIVSKDASLAVLPDETKSTYVGTLGGRLKVYVDPFVDLGSNFYTVGYKGSSPYDAGLFYCPYIPLQFTKATHPLTFQPTIGFRTRYGLKEHPFSGSTFVDDNTTRTNANSHKNVFYRISAVNHLN